MTHHDTFLQMAIGKMTFLCGSLLRIPKKVSIFVRLPATWGNQIYDSSDLFYLDYQTWKWQWSDRHSIRRTRVQPGSVCFDSASTRQVSQRLVRPMPRSRSRCDTTLRCPRFSFFYVPLKWSLFFQHLYCPYLG